MNNNNLNSKNVDALVGIVSKKLGMQPDVLKQQLQQGKFDAALQNMNAADAAKFQQVLKNPKIAEQIMSTSQAQAIYKKITSEK
jgi:hypothetical protein